MLEITIEKMREMQNIINNVLREQCLSLHIKQELAEVLWDTYCNELVRWNDSTYTSGYWAEIARRRSVDFLRRKAIRDKYTTVLLLSASNSSPNYLVNMIQKEQYDRVMNDMDERLKNDPEAARMFHELLEPSAAVVQKSVDHAKAAGVHARITYGMIAECYGWDEKEQNRIYGRLHYQIDRTKRKTF